jgi:hypothetical protein
LIDVSIAVAKLAVSVFPSLDKASLVLIVVLYNLEPALAMEVAFIEISFIF